MPRYPAAIWEPITGGTDGPVTGWLGLVLHVNDSDGADLYQWENNGTNGMSSHFQAAKDGRLFQYLDTSVDSWCQMSGNKTYLSVETEGYPTEPLTDAQVQALAKLYAWLHRTHGIPLRIADVVGQSGFGWHGMGGDAWGGHVGCPGDLRKAQRQHMLDLAAGTPAPTQQEEDVARLMHATDTNKTYLVSVAHGAQLVNGATEVTRHQSTLAALHQDATIYQTDSSHVETWRGQIARENAL